MSWLEEIEENCTTDVKIILIGNKIDLTQEWEVSTEEGINLAKEKGLFFKEVSAKINHDGEVEEAFEIIVEECRKIIERDR